MRDESVQHNKQQQALCRNIEVSALKEAAPKVLHPKTIKGKNKTPLRLVGVIEAPLANQMPCPTII